MPTKHVLLGGVVGSQAYGLATPTSDTDRLAVFAYDTLDILSLEDHRDSIHTTNPDVTLHEALKFARLALKCNPTVSELLWLKDYESITYEGSLLVQIRTSFLSSKYVRNAYFGYATSQYNKVLSGETFARGEKHARHLLRLLNQGIMLLSSAHLQIQVLDSQWYFDTARSMCEHPSALREYMHTMERLYDEALKHTPLPSEPDFDTVNDWLLHVRKAFMK